MNYTDEEILNDFRLFVIVTWSHLGLPKPTKMQLYIADYLQSGHSRMVLQALRGIGKSWITAAYVAWRLLRNPNEKILIVSQSGTHAENIAIFIKRLIRGMKILQHLQARGNQRDTTTSFDVNGASDTIQPSVKALGITSQLQGNRATLIISDDVEGQQNSATEQMRMKLKSATAEYEAILQTDESSQIIVLGTPQSAESIYTGFREDGYTTMVFPALYPENIEVYNGCLAPYIIEEMKGKNHLINTPIDSRFTEEDLLRRANRYGKSGFKLQFMLDTTLSDAERFPLKLSDLIVCDLGTTTAPISINYSSINRIESIPNVGFNGDGFYSPSAISSDVREYEGVYMGIDPSGKGKDETSYSVVAHMGGKLFLLDSGGYIGGYETDTLINLANKAMEYSVNKVFAEENFGSGMFSTLLRPVMNAIYPCMIEDINSKGQKEARIIDTLEPIMNTHRLVVDKSMVMRDVMKALRDDGTISYSLFYQMSHITKDKGSLTHDDALDVLAMTVMQWQRVLLQNPDNALERYKQKQLDEQVNEFVRRHRKSKKMGYVSRLFR